MDKWHSLVCVHFVLDAFEQGKLQSIPTFMSDGEVRKDEVGSFLWSIEIGRARHRDAGQYGNDGRRMHLAASNRPGNLEAGIQHESRIIEHRDVGVIAEYAKFDHRRRVNRSAVGGCCGNVSKGLERERDEKYSHLGPDPQALAFSGCCTTSSLYVMHRPSMVTLECSLFVSFGG